MAAAIPKRVVSGCEGRPGRRRTSGGLVRFLHLQTTIAGSEEQKETGQRSTVKHTLSCKCGEEHGIPDNLEDVADSGFFFWHMEAVWTRS